MYSFEGLFYNVKDGYLGACLILEQTLDRPACVSSLLTAPPVCCSDSCQHRSEALMRAEAVVRGHRAGLLTVQDYNNLCQCESLEDIKLSTLR